MPPPNVLVPSGRVILALVGEWHVRHESTPRICTGSGFSASAGDFSAAPVVGGHGAHVSARCLAWLNFACVNHTVRSGTGLTLNAAPPSPLAAGSIAWHF